MHPQRDRGGSQRYADRGIAAWGKGPVERRTDVVDPRAKICQPFIGWSCLRLRLSALKKIQIMTGMASRHRVELASFNELFERISAGRLKQPIAYPRAASVHRHERFCDQARNAIDHLQGRNVVIRCYRARSLQCEAAGEDGQVTQYYALGLGQQLVAPIECRS